MRLSSKSVILSAVSGAAALMVSGCQTAAPTNQASAPPAAPAPMASTAIRSDVTDIRPLASTLVANPAMAQTAAYQVASEDAAPQPITYATLATVTPVAFSSSRSAGSTISVPAAGNGNTHTVRHGETLYSIARESYGSGKQWKKIAMANPGVTPATLKVGQSLVIP